MNTDTPEHNDEFSLSKFHRDISDLDTFVEIVRGGIVAANNERELFHLHREVEKIRGNPDPYTSENELNKVLVHIERREIFAKREQETGYPYIYELATIRLWTILETMVDSLIVSRLKVLSDIQNVEQLKRIRISVIEFLSASRDELAEIVLNELKNYEKANLNSGLGRFEPILNAVGMAGEVNPVIRRELFELGNVRNVLVHRNGIVDKKLVEACPWLESMLGKRLNLNGRYFEKYLFCAYWYLLELDVRIMNKELETSSEEKIGRINDCKVTQSELVTKIEWLNSLT